MDTRSLGVFRIVFGLVLLSDLLRRWVELSYWYVNSGLLPNHTLLWRPPAGHQFSLFFTVSSPGEAHLAFALCALVYVLLVLGFRTRWVQLLAVLVRVSLNSRLAVLENGGDMVMDLLCLFTLPLPLGQRFSLDAVGQALRAERDEAGAKPQPLVSVVSLAVLGLILQFAAIYFFNASSKNGVGWRDGSAVHYALHQDKLVTWIGVWMRENLPVWAIRGLTRATLLTEWVGFAVIITPFFVRQSRALAVCLLPPLHLGFSLGLNLGGFTPAMLAFYPLLLTHEHWAWLTQRFGERLRAGRERVEGAARRALSSIGARFSAPREPSGTRRILGEVGVVLVLVAITFEALNDNAAVPTALRFRAPAWTKAVIEYPRILQGWRMFAPEPPRTDAMIFVDARTASGRQVDPYNEVASDQHYPSGLVVPRHMGQSQFFVMYSDRIANVGYAAYRQAFSEWLLAYPERTGEPSDCLLKYDVYLVSDRSPQLGKSTEPPTPLDRQRFMTYAAPWNGPCRPLHPAQPGKKPSSAH
ncbi:MAG TPA: HTTM domain-containing protein [Polyangiaceae bacterium]